MTRLAQPPWRWALGFDAALPAPSSSSGSQAWWDRGGYGSYHPFVSVYCTMIPKILTMEVDKKERKKWKVHAPLHLLYLKPWAVHTRTEKVSRPPKCSKWLGETGTGLPPHTKVHIITHFLHRALSSLRKIDPFSCFVPVFKPFWPVSARGPGPASPHGEAWRAQGLAGSRGRALLTNHALAMLQANFHLVLREQQPLD